MRTVVALTLIVCVGGTGSPAAAQEPTEAKSGPLARAVTREATRLAATRVEPTVIDNVEPNRQSGPSDWSRVRQLAPGTKIIVTVRGAPSIHWSFRSADDSQLVVSNGGVEQIARTDVAEISVLKKHDLDSVANSPSFKWGVVIGLAAGLATAGITLHSYCKTHSCDTAPAVAIGFYTMMGFLIGGGVGALVAVTDHTATVIYRVL